MVLHELSKAKGLIIIEIWKALQAALNFELM